jgi:hypothetical protein
MFSNWAVIPPICVMNGMFGFVIGNAILELGCLPNRQSAVEGALGGLTFSSLVSTINYYVLRDDTDHRERHCVGWSLPKPHSQWTCLACWGSRTCYPEQM